jgi:thiol-disulfide isomerase/thioredoxin
MGRGVITVLTCFGAPAFAAEQPVRYPAGSVLLLVAPWCAPCHAEISRLDAIAQAAKPRAVRVFMVEDGPRAQAMWRGVPAVYRWTPPANEERRYRSDAMSRAAGLPFGFVTDASGRVCAAKGGGMDAERVGLLIADCGKA